MQASEGNVPVVRIVLAAWGFFSRNLVTVYQLGAPYILASVLGVSISMFASPGSPLILLGSFFSMAAFVLYFSMQAALFRLALGLPAKGMRGLGLGEDEFRLFGTHLLIALVAVIVVAVSFVIILLVISSILLIGVDPQMVQDDPNLILEQAGMKFWVLQGLGVLSVFVILLYLFARFAPAYPAAIGEKTIRIFEAAAWTKGQGWRIALGMVITVLPIYLLMSPFIFIMIGQMKIIMQMAISQPGVTPSTEQMHIDFQWRILPILLAPALDAIRAGLFSTLYRGLRPA
ncbi:hypothetical protein MNBD_ALPHA06-1647 [hydrothermal vent metagenome]|uniref:Glycerophosphoryl diester phosphodiesterase membrane domain-containing protein n=1 Tax=hydrothermal vent metagenome TaxID=652676 RepID=A0A3B0R2U9_9ZZZZ